MTPKSTKEKGRRFARRILEIVRRELDPQAYEVKGSGQGLDKGDVYCPTYNLLIEAKNQRQIAVQAWLREAENDAHQRRFAVVWADPATPQADPRPWAAVDFGEFLRIMKTNQGEREIGVLSSREVRFHLGRAVEHLKRVIRLEP